MTVVLDANVILSGLATPRGECAKVLKSAVGGTVLLSFPLITEVESGFEKPYFREAALRNDIVGPWQELIGLSSIREIGELPQVETDPNDLHILALARDGRADVIVTGDKRLLALDPWEGVRILRPAEFLDFAERTA